MYIYTYILSIDTNECRNVNECPTTLSETKPDVYNDKAYDQPETYFELMNSLIDTISSRIIFIIYDG